MIDDLLESLISGFAEESQEICEQITRDLLGLEQDPDGEAGRKYLDGVARGLHTLKGTSATVGLDELSELAHRLEDLIAPVRLKGGKLRPVTVDALLRGLDGFLERVRARASGHTVPPTDDLLAMLAQAGALPVDLGLDVAQQQALATTQPEIEQSSPIPTLVTAAPPPPTGNLPWEEKEATPAAPREAPAHVDLAPVEEEGTWRVRSRDLFALTHEVERIRELRLRMDQRGRDLSRSLQEASLSSLPPELRQELATLSRGLRADAEEAGELVETAESAVRAMATVPVRSIVEPLRRAVRDLCRQLDREARLSVVGAEQAIDRRVLEGLRGPLLHLVRNAVGHGVESPADRERAGKHREGSIVVRVEQRGNLLDVAVEDDGRGLDTARIREEAFLRGLIPDAQENLPAERVHELIFQPGFSTSTRVTSSSGRGIGLDVVRSEVTALGGDVEVQSTRGQGVRFHVSVPIDFGSSPLLVFRVGEHRLALPMLTVRSVLAARAEDVRGGAGRLRLVVGEEGLLLHRVGVLLGLELPNPPIAEQPVLVVEARGKRVALVVDEILGDRDLVIRGLPPELRDLPAYQGAATLVEGELVLVLRADWLVTRESKPVEGDQSHRRALVVDDSLTARALHRTVLESGGFSVHTAADGAGALQRLASDNYQLVVADIGMEGMDGLTLVREIRARANLRAVPIILVSGRDEGEGRKEGLAAGADAFLSKKDCVSGRLLSESARIMARSRTS